MMRVAPPALALVAILFFAAIAVAADPVKGARYAGHVRHAGVPIEISFKVSRSGRRVTSLTLNVPNLPNTCGYGGPDEIRPAKAKIEHGRFTAKLSQRTTGGVLVATAKVTGRFRAGGKETGRTTTKSRTESPCDGVFRYSARAQM